MDSDIKSMLDKIVSSIDDMKRINLSDIKQKLQDLDLREIKSMLSDIKSRVESIENKIQK